MYLDQPLRRSSDEAHSHAYTKMPFHPHVDLGQYGPSLSVPNTLLVRSGCWVVQVARE